MIRPFRRFFAICPVPCLVGACLLVAACGSLRSSPNEFDVMARAPLHVPPNSDLRPPRPGEPHALPLDPGRIAFEALFPGKTFRRQQPLSRLEQRLVGAVGQSTPDVRTSGSTSGNNSDKNKVTVVKKTLLLAEILDAADRVYRPDAVTIQRSYTDSINPEDQPTDQPADQPANRTGEAPR